MTNSVRAHHLIALFDRLLGQHGPQAWWPAETPFEMILGAYLTQNTAWRNVDLALANLRDAGALSIPALRAMPIEELELLLRPSGFYRQKASRVKAFIRFLDEEFGSELDRLLAVPMAALRERLLALPGIGRETADCILLYAAHRPVFPIDAYTRRLLLREDVYPDALTADYEDLRQRIESAFAAKMPDIAERTTAFNEFHALIVEEGKQFRVSKRY